MSTSSSTPTFKVGLTAEEKSLYTQLFKSLDPENTGVVTGEKARTTFEKSGLPPSILGEIWQIADSNNLGFLNQFGFCYAMRLIGYTQSGQHPAPGLADVPGPLPKFVNLNIVPNALQPQSTSSSFMSTQPNASIPHSAVPQDALSAVSPVDYQKFSQLFIKTVGSPYGELSGGQARDIFLKAKLATPVLGQIWGLVDRYNLGKLNVGGFVIAMHLIQGLLSGQIKQLPPFLPESIWNSVEQQPQQQDQPQTSRQVSHSSISSQSTAIRHPAPPSRDASSSAVAVGEWVATPAMKQQYESVFNNLDKEKKGQLSPDQVASFLMTSKLNQQDLAVIWDLADIQNSGIFNKLEFSIALFLVNRKLAGKSLPNIVPDELLTSLKQSPVPEVHTSSVASTPSAQPRTVSEVNKGLAPPQAPASARAKSSMDDLVDIFGSAPASANASGVVNAGTTDSPAPFSAPPPQAQLQQRSSSSDLVHGDLPKVRTTLTGSFKPTSTFGQSLLQQQQQHSSPQPVASPVEEKAPQGSVSNVQAEHSPQPPQVQQQQKVVNYDALRSVPPPPQRKTMSPAPTSPQPPTPTSQQFASQLGGTPTQQRGISNTATNDDLLADPATSGQLSQATSDIANVSNQIKSLTTQTTSLHEKKTRAEQELQRILKVKTDIEAKLKQLRASYDNEVKQVELVESNLATAKEETEALRSETSIAEAKVNSLSSQLHEKQVAMENLQLENSTLKEKLGSLNAEVVELESQVTSKSSETQALSNQVSVKKSQVQVAIVKSEELKGKLRDIEASHKQLQLDLDNAERNRLAAEQEAKNLQAKSVELEQNKPTKPSPGMVAAAGAAVGAAVGGAAGVIHHLAASSSSSDSKDVIGHNKDIPSESQTNIDSINQSFPSLEVSGQHADNATNTTNSNITERGTDEGETPITSPSNSDFQFPQGNNAGIVGGMVGMPGVLVGVQRTESLTSSVQNNAALSVRDDNIDEISDRETLENVESGEEETAPNTANTANFEDRDRQHFEGSDKGSSSFEMVNSEEARSPEGNDEFPPIRELDYQESESSSDDDDDDDDDEEEQTFDDALDHVQQQQQQQQQKEQQPNVPSTPAGASTAFDDFEFDDLQPAAPEPKTGTTTDKDFFNDEFSNLQAANVATTGDEEFETGKDDFGGLSEDFTNSNAPDFTQPNTSTSGGNDEWEQLFAGFGNAQAQPEPTHSQPEFGNNYTTESQNNHSNSNSNNNTPFGYLADPEPAKSADALAVQELVGMGFDENTALDALKRSNGDLEAATNYLLDNA